MAAAYGDLYALSQRFAAASGQSFPAAAGQLVDSYANQIASMAQSYAPVRTGALRQSITVSRPAPLQAVIGPHVGYGGYQEFGTSGRGEYGGAGYDIRPKRPGGVLRFQAGGRTVYARKVHHPGAVPHPYMRPAFERIITPFGQSLADLGASYVSYGPHQPTSLPTSAAA